MTGRPVNTVVVDALQADWLGQSEDGGPGRQSLELTGAQAGQSMVKIGGDTFAFPGLTNSHDHLEFACHPPLAQPPHTDTRDWAAYVHRHEATRLAPVEKLPVDLRRRWGAARNLLCGVTAVMDHGPPRRSDPLPGSITVLDRYRFAHSPEFYKWRGHSVWPPHFPLVVHLAEGRSQACRQSARSFLRRFGWLGPVIGVHGMTLAPADVRRLRALVWCPASNQYLFGHSAPVGDLKSNTTILFGTDSPISAPGTLFDHLRLARELGGLSDRELFDALTVNARWCWRRQPAADFVIASRRDGSLLDSFFALRPEDILVVATNGRLVVIDDEIATRADIEFRRSWTRIKLAGASKWVCDLKLGDLDTMTRTLGRDLVAEFARGCD